MPSEKHKETDETDDEEKEMEKNCIFLNNERKKKWTAMVRCVQIDDDKSVL